MRRRAVAAVTTPVIGIKKTAALKMNPAGTAIVNRPSNENSDTAPITRDAMA